MSIGKFSTQHVEIVVLMILTLTITFIFINPVVYGQSNLSNIPNESAKITLSDKSLMAQPYISGLKVPMNMAFVGNDTLVVEKDTGNVKLIRDGKLQPNPVLTLNVSSNTFEEGLLGIATKGSTVYLHFTERDPQNKVSNLFYKYTWDGNRLVNPVLLKEIHGGSGLHNGGVIVTDAKKGTPVYAIIGDLNNRKGVLQNHPDNGTLDDTSVIFPLESKNPHDYYAIGIRTSFGLAIDPVTGGGQAGYDEVNLLTPKFNSGWDILMGPANSTMLSKIPHYDGYTYHDPKFTWQEPVGAAAISFIRLPLFKQYQNSVLVGGFHNGIIYELKLNKDRTGFVVEQSSLADLVLNKNDNKSAVIFGTGFGGISDIKEGPDGLIYVISYSEGTIYRIVPKNMALGLGT
jgi:glucose/arabinose dehydrogenase